MKEFDEAKRRINKIFPSGNLQTSLVDAMNSLLDLCGALMGNQVGSSVEIGKAKPVEPVEGPKGSGTPVPGKEDPRKNSTMKAEEKSKVSDLIDSISKVKK